MSLEACNGYGACAEAVIAASLRVAENSELTGDTVAFFTGAAVAATYDDELKTLGLLRTIATAVKNSGLW